MEFCFSLLEFFGEALAVFEFVEVGGNGVGSAFACTFEWLVSAALEFEMGRVNVQGGEDMYLEHSTPCMLAHRLSHLGTRYKLLLHWQRSLLRSCVRCL